MARKQYFELASLENLYLEDSYVLKIDERGDKLVFYMDLVLTESHPEYHEPRPNEQYCYRYGSIEFSAVVRANWIERNNKFSTDAAGDKDIGNIDVFYCDDSTYHLYGSWGEVEIVSALPVATLLPKEVPTIIGKAKKF